MLPPTNQRKRSHDLASTAAAPVMSRSLSHGVQSVRGKAVRHSSSIACSPSSSVSSHTTAIDPSSWSIGSRMTNMPSKLQTDQWTSYAPAAYISSIVDVPTSAKRQRQASMLMNTTSIASPVTSFGSTINSSYASSNWTRPSSISSPLLCATNSFHDAQWPHAASMSRQPSVASSSGLSRPFEQLMKRTESSASHPFAPATEPMFPLEEVSPHDSLASAATFADTLGLYGFEQHNDLLAATGQIMSSISQQTEYAEDLPNVDTHWDESLISTELPTATSMQRIGSNNSSTSSAASRVNERRQRQIENGIRQPIASKPTLSTTSNSVTANLKTHKRPISKLASRRQKHEKEKCPLCDQRPEGFHGAHELRRHMERAHATTFQTVWICQQPEGLPKPQRPLDNCKACKDGKQYNVYYNAAAHIRRAHFHPRPRGRRPRGTESRAGKAGGDQPPISELKANGWIRSMEVPAKTDFQEQTESAYDELEETTCFGEMDEMIDQQQPWPQEMGISSFDGNDTVLDSLHWENSTLQNVGTGITLPAELNTEDPFEADFALDEHDWN